MASWSKTIEELIFEPNRAYQSGRNKRFLKIVVSELKFISPSMISDTKIELKEYEHTISYLLQGEDIEKGVKNVADRFSLIGVKLGKLFFNSNTRLTSKYSELKSKWEKYIYIWYIPTIMITISSWFFYLLPSTSYPARLGGWNISQFQFLMSCQGPLF